MKTNNDYFKKTDEYDKKISELVLQLDKISQGGNISSQIARLTSDINKSKGVLELARLYYRKAEQALLATNPEEIGVFATALENYEKTAQNYYEAVETQFFYSNMSAISLSFVSTWPDPTRLANAGAIVMKLFVTAFTIQVSGTFKNWVDRKILNVGFKFGLELVAQTSHNLMTTIAHRYTQLDYKKLPIPDFGEDYPALNPNSESPAFNLEMFRLKNDHINPILETYILINAILKVVADENAKSGGNHFHLTKFFDAWMDKYQTEEEFHAVYPGVTHTLKDFILHVETKRYHNSNDEYYRNNKGDFEAYVEPFDAAWKANKERLAAYLKYSYLIMDKYTGIVWTNEELALFPPSSMPDIAKPPE